MGCASIREAGEWLSRKTIRLYPKSQFARRMAAGLCEEPPREKRRGRCRICAA